MLESVLNNGGLLWNNLQALFAVHAIAKRAVPGNDRAVLYLAVKYNADSLPAQVRFILCNGETEVDIQPPAAVVVSYCSWVVSQPRPKSP